MTIVSSEIDGSSRRFRMPRPAKGTSSFQKIISALHQGSWPSVEGNLSWDAVGQPQGQDLLVEWLNGKLVPVYPPSVAQASPTIPKPTWAG